jgi:uncharacterized delta-60 repeat protein
MPAATPNRKSREPFHRVLAHVGVKNMKLKLPMKNSNPIKTLLFAACLLLQLSALCLHSRGAPGDVDLSFDPGSGVNNTVNVIAVQPDGKVIIGGPFTTVEGLARSRIARLNADGSGDASFNAGTNISDFVSPTALALQPDGKVLVGHDQGVFRLHPDGGLDTGFSATLGKLEDGDGNSYSVVNAIVVQPDGRILIGGYFLTGSGTNLNAGIARLNSDGSVDASFDTGTLNAGVYSLALQADGKVVIAGFLYVTNSTASAVARLNADGSVDPTFAPAGSGFVVSVAVQADGKVFFGGPDSGITRVNADGSPDNTFNPGTAPDGWIKSIAVQTNGKVLIGGSFAVVNGTNRSGIARLNANGTLDESFNPGAGIGGLAYTEVNAVIVQSNGAVLLAGSFTTVNGAARSRMARLNADGSLDSNFNSGSGVNGSVNSLVVQSDGRVLIGGQFSTAGDLVRSGIARLHPNGSGDGNFGSSNFTSGWVGPLALQPDGKILIGGTLHVPDPQALERLHPNGSLDGSFQPVIGEISSGYDYVTPTVIVPQSDGKVLVGGYSTHYECDPFDGGCVIWDIPFLQRLNTNGSPDTSFSSTVTWSGRPQAVAVQPDGKILVAGPFATVQGMSRKGIARLNTDGSLDASFDPGEGAFGISSIVLQPDGKVLIGGNFASVNGAFRQGIARLQANGSVDASFNVVTFIGANEVAAVAQQPNGKVLIAGWFTTINGTTRNSVARLNTDGTLDTSFDPGSGPDQRVRSMALTSDGNVLIGGYFTTVNGMVRPHVARLFGDSVLVPSLSIARAGGLVTISWPLSATGYLLDESLSLTGGWSQVAFPYLTNGNLVSASMPSPTGAKFFRLRKE